jgi:hypothetical protein
MKVERNMRRKCVILLKGNLHVCGKVRRGEDEILNSMGESVWQVQARGLILKPMLVETLKCLQRPQTLGLKLTPLT